MIKSEKLQRIAVFLQPTFIGYLSKFVANNVSKMMGVTSMNMLFLDLKEKSSLVPPRYVFVVAWLFLYLLIGIAAYLILVADKSMDKRKAIVWNQVQLLFNFMWMIIYFGLGMPLVAMIEILLLWLSIAKCMIHYRRVNAIAFYLMIPYICWITFAIYLNYLALV